MQNIVEWLYVSAIVMIYYIITYNSDCENIETIADYEMDDFDLTLFWEGKRYDDKIPSDVRLFIDEQNEGLLTADILPNPISWLIVSQKLQELWWSFIKDDVQVFDPPIYRQSDGSKVQGYALLNPIRALDCLDDEQSVPPRKPDQPHPNYIKFCIKKNCVGNHHIFRLSEYKFAVFASDTLAQILVGKDIRGIAFIRCKTV